MSEKCPFDPSTLIGVPIGMFHCEFCGEMVVAGLPHPDYSLLDDPDFGPPPLAPHEQLQWIGDPFPEEGTSHAGGERDKM